jgi:hypothetical protein
MMVAPTAAAALPAATAALPAAAGKGITGRSEGGSRERERGERNGEGLLVGPEHCRFLLLFESVTLCDGQESRNATAFAL